MNILGLSNGETSSACLIKNGKLIAAASEERFTRIKQDNSWPINAIQYVLKEGKIKINQIDKVCYSWSKGFNETKLLINYFDRIVYETKHNPKGLKLFRDRIKVELARDPIKRKEYFIFLKKNNLTNKGYIIDHHEGHMYSALCFSNYKDGLVITSDGRGDFESFTITEFKEDQIKQIYTAPSNDSLGTFYARISKLLGFIPHRHEGKVTGLSARGNYKKCIHLMEKMINFKNGKIIAVAGDYYKSFHEDYGKYKAWSRIAKLKLKKYKREDIAAAAQKHLENVILKMVRYYLKKTNKKNICLAGGVFANVRVNQKIRELKEVNNLYIQPHMGDGGLALGAAAGYYFKKKHKRINLKNMYLGPSYSFDNLKINRLEKKFKVKFKKIKNLTNFVVDQIYDNKVIGFFQGRMEFGPRALCNRSILYHCYDININTTLNKRLNRNEFMPFAPVVAESFANKAFINWNRKHISSKYMTMTYDCTKFFKKLSPAVIHVDGTARPQIINKNDNELMNKILIAWFKKTNQISLLNTSFNHHEEPIVCSPEDAIRSFLKKNVDILIINDYQVYKNQK